MASKERVAFYPSPHLEMQATISKNAIFFKTVHSCCLACDIFITSEKDVMNHIETEGHINNLKDTMYVPEYIDDRIRKVKKGFFCEFCNKCINTSATIKFHTASLEHLGKKSNQVYIRLDDGGIILKKAYISKKAWNGVIDDKCVLCDCEFEDFESHITTQTHLFHMVQGSIDFGIRKGVFRKIDNIFQCLTCNVIFLLNRTSLLGITMHFMQKEHRETFERLEKIGISMMTADSSKDAATDLSFENATGPLPDNAAAQLSNLTKPTEQKPEPTRGGEGWEVIRRNRLIKKQAMDSFITGFYGTRDPRTNHIFVIINTKFVINILSFHFITNEQALKCALCQVNLTTVDKIEAHKSTTKHEAAMREVQVILLRSALGEFLREVRPDVFHCGFCNIIRNGLDNVVKHLASETHELCKTSASKRLREHNESKKKA